MSRAPRLRAPGRLSSLVRAALGVTLAASLLLPAGASFAQTDEEKAAARALATQGADALKNNRFADALDLVSRAQAIVHAPTHLLMIARAQTGLGKLVGAQEAYLKLLREELSPSAPAAFRNAQAAAKDELAAIEPKIGALRVTVDGAVQKKATIKLDDRAMSTALLGVFQPIDPGTHVVTVYPVGQSPIKGSVDVKEGEKKEIRLAVPDGPLLPGVPVNATDNPDAARPDSTQSRDTTSGGFMTPLRAAGIGVGAAGVVLGGVMAGVFFSQAASKTSAANAICNGPGGLCPTSMMAAVQADDNSAASAKTNAAIGLGIGGALVVTGVVLIIVGKPKAAAAAPPPTASITPWFSGTGAGLRGTF